MSLKALARKVLERNSGWSSGGKFVPNHVPRNLVIHTSNGTSGTAFTDDQREAFEERAAVLEFDGEYRREEAERIARDELTVPSAMPPHFVPFGGPTEPTDI